MSACLISFPTKSEQYGHDFEVQIIDTEYSSSARYFRLAPGLSIEYESQSDERYSVIKGSKCTIPMLVENVGQENILFNNILNAVDEGEDRFFAVVYRNSQLYWVGVLLPDLFQRQDASYPYQMTLTATDGLARLKDLPFTEALTNVTASINSTLFLLIKKLPLYKYFTYAGLTTARLWSNSVNWYEANMSAVSSTTDPFTQTFFRRWALVDIDKEDTNNNKPISCYDALETILLQFNCRILLSEGYFKIVTVNLYNKTNILYERIYDYAGNFVSASSPGWNDTVDQVTYFVEAGNQWQYYPAARSVSRNFEIGKSQNLIDPSIPLTTGQGFNAVLGGTGRKLRILVTYNYGVSGLISITIAPIITATLVINCGVYYLANIPTGGYVWTMAATTCTVEMGVTQYGTMIISIITPDLPSGTHSPCSIQVLSIALNSGGTLSYSQVQALVDTNNDFDFKLYRVQNNSSLINSKDYELPEARIGDGPDYSSNQALFIGTSGSPTDLSSAWSVDKTGPTYDINELLIREIISGQKIPCPRYQGQVITDVPPHFAIWYDDDKYILNGGSQDLIKDKYNAEWFKIQSISTDLDVTNSGTPNINNAIQTIREGVGDTQRAVATGNNNWIKFSSERAFTRLKTDVSGTVTSIDVDATTRDIKDGDKVILFPNQGGVIYELNITADAGAGATTIYISSFTPSEDISEGSGLFFPFRSPVINYLRLEDGFPTSDPGIVGVAWWDTSTKNMKISNG